MIRIRPGAAFSYFNPAGLGFDSQSGHINGQGPLVSFREALQWNGVQRNPWATGSVIHKHHRIMKTGRDGSFGSKQGMDDPTANQLSFKLYKLYCYDAGAYKRHFYEYVGSHGWWERAPVHESEARWNVSLEAAKHTHKLIYDLPEGKSFFGFCMYARDRQIPDSWTVNAWLQCAVWSLAPEILIALEWEIEASELSYSPAVNYWRSVSTRPYMSHYPAGYLMRLVPFYVHVSFIPLIKAQVHSPEHSLPNTHRLISSLLSSEKQDEFRLRVKDGSAAMLELTKKHFSFIYEYPAVIFFICAFGMAGAAARCILRTVGTELLGSPPSDGLLAMLEQRKDQDHDQFLFPFISADPSQLLVWLTQFALADPKCRDEWVALATHPFEDVEHDPVIENEFHTRYPNIHLALSLYVDTHPHDDFRCEGDFSVIRMLKRAEVTQRRFDMDFFIRQNFIAPIFEESRDLGRQTQKKGFVKGHRTHEQCRMVCEKLEEMAGELFTEEKMEGKTVAGMKRAGLGFRESEEKLEQVKSEWKKTYNRSISESDLRERGQAIRLALAPRDPDGISRCISESEEYLHPSLYTNVKAPVFHLEMSCFVPFFFWALKTYRNQPLSETTPPLHKFLHKLLTNGWGEESVLKTNGTLVKKHAIAWLRLFSENANLIREYAPEFIFVLVTPLFFSETMKSYLISAEGGGLLRHGKSGFFSQLARFKNAETTGSAFDI